MNPDCTHCAEWELCPFHPKEERAPETVTVCGAGCLSLDSCCHVYASEPETWEQKRARIVRLSSDCGEYVRTYRDGKLVDEEPAEAYADHTIDAMVRSYKSIRCETGRHSFSQRNGLAHCWCGEPPVKR